MAVGSLILVRDHLRPEPGTAGLEAKVAALETAVRAQAATPRWSGAGRAAVESVARAGGPAEGSPRQPEAHPGGLDRPPPVTYEQSRAAVLDAYAAEAVDASWSADATRRLGAAIRDRLPHGSQLAALECRATMCQVKLIHAGTEAPDGFLLGGLEGWRGSVFVAGREQSDAGLAVTLVTAREGTRLPL